MRDSLPYLLLADVVLALHVAIVVFVVGGLVLVVIGNRRNWRWVNALWFRLAHLGAIAVVVAEVWLGVTCPFTTLEFWLRTKAHATAYSGSFIGHWLQRILYYDAPPWVFVVGYSLFGLLVLATWVRFPPVSKRRNNEKDA
ncbi:MAG: DUF2784 domain-containing protein [Betaproteobacteria bacterium]|nr:DUF2784 domain-containing protein [Betaproteobacteria bacterium]